MAGDKGRDPRPEDFFFNTRTNDFCCSGMIVGNLNVNTGSYPEKINWTNLTPDFIEGLRKRFDRQGQVLQAVTVEKYNNMSDAQLQFQSQYVVGRVLEACGWHPTPLFRGNHNNVLRGWTYIPRTRVTTDQNMPKTDIKPISESTGTKPAAKPSIGAAAKAGRFRGAPVVLVPGRKYYSRLTGAEVTERWARQNPERVVSEPPSSLRRRAERHRLYG